MRILLLRLLIGWWAIPIVCPLLFVLSWLMEGDVDESVKFIRWFARAMWFGDLD